MDDELLNYSELKQMSYEELKALEKTYDDARETYIEDNYDVLRAGNTDKLDVMDLFNKELNKIKSVKRSGWRKKRRLLYCHSRIC